MIDQELIWFGDDCSRFLPNASHQEYQLAYLLSSSIYDLSKNVCIPWLLPCFSTAQPQPPRLPRRILGAEAGRRCITRLGEAIAPWSSSWSLRGPRCTRPPNTAVAPEGFSGRFGSGSDEVTEGARTWAGDFRAVLWDAEWYPYVLFKDPLLWWDGPLEIRVKEMRWNE